MTLTPIIIESACARWVLVGLWTGNLNTWSTELTYYEFLEIYRSTEFTTNIHL